MSKLSIFIPTYNYVYGLAQSLEQLRNQKHYNPDQVRLIISDDSNGDEILHYYDAVKAHIPNLQYLRGPQTGAVSNWNLSLANSASEYTMFLHHDEYVQSEHFLATILNVLDDSKCDLLILPLIKDMNGYFYKHYPISLKWLFIRFPKLLFACNAFGSPSLIVIKNDLIEKFDHNLNWYVDVEWYFRHLMKKPKVKLLDDPSLTIISDLNFTGSITKNLDVKKILQKEKHYIISKHNLPQYLFGYFLTFLRLPVKLYEIFNV